MSESKRGENTERQPEDTSSTPFTSWLGNKTQAQPQKLQELQAAINELRMNRTYRMVAQIVKRQTVARDLVVGLATGCFTGAKSAQ